MKNKDKVQTNFDKLIVYTPMSFGNWLRKNINNAGISNAELARRTKFSPTYIGNLVRDFYPNSKDGEGRPSEDAVRKIAKALNCDVNEAMTQAGYRSDDELVANGLFSGYYDLSPEDQKLARRQIAALIRSFNEEEK